MIKFTWRYNLVMSLVMVSFFINCSSSSKNDKESLEEHLEYGRLYFQFGTYFGYLRAERQFLRALKIDPTCAEAWLRLGDIYYIFYEKDLWDKKPVEARQKLENAYKYYLSALYYKPDCIEAFIGLAVLEYCYQRYDKAIDYLLKAQSIPTDDKYLKGRIHWMLGRCYNASINSFDPDGKTPEGRKRLRQAMEEFEKYLQLIPEGEHADSVRQAIMIIQRTLESPSQNNPEHPSSKQ